MNPNLEQRLQDAIGSLAQWCTQAEQKYSLGPLELLTVLSNVVSVRIGHEAEIERAAIEQLRGTMSKDSAFTQEFIGDVLGNPTCCQKHNMMGKTLGRCGGGPPGTRSGRKTGPEQATEDTTAEGIQDA